MPIPLRKPRHIRWQTQSTSSVQDTMCSINVSNQPSTRHCHPLWSDKGTSPRAERSGLLTRHREGKKGGLVFGMSPGSSLTSSLVVTSYYPPRMHMKFSGMVLGTLAEGHGSCLPFLLLTPTLVLACCKQDISCTNGSFYKM